MTATTLSRRGLEAPASPIRALASIARDAQASGKHVHFMNIGQPDIATPRGMIEAYRNYDEKVLAYAPSDGFEEYERLWHPSTTTGSSVTSHPSRPRTSSSPSVDRRRSLRDGLGDRPR